LPCRSYVAASDAQSQSDSLLNSRRRQIESTGNAAASVPSSCWSRKRSNTNVRFLRFRSWILREDKSTDKQSSRRDLISLGSLAAACCVVVAGSTARVRHSRMLLAGIHASFGLDRRLKHSGVTTWGKVIRGPLDSAQLAAG